MGLYCYDPTSQRVTKDYGGVGPSHTIGSTIPRGFGVDATHAYVNSGEIPRYLVAVELASGKEKVLFETPLQTAQSGARMEIVLEARPGRLLSLTAAAEGSAGTRISREAAGVLYGVDLSSGEVLFRKSLPLPPGTDGDGPHWVDPSREDLDLARDSEGFVWTYLKNVLARINPKDAIVHAVGRLDHPGRLLFVDDDVYLSGAADLRRIRKIVPRNAGKGRN